MCPIHGYAAALRHGLFDGHLARSHTSMINNAAMPKAAARDGSDQFRLVNALIHLDPVTEPCQGTVDELTPDKIIQPKPAVTTGTRGSAKRSHYDVRVGNGP